MNNEEMFLTILNRMDSMETSLNGRMGNLDGRMEKVENGLTCLDCRMKKVENGLTGLNGRMEKVESCLTGLNGRIEKLGNRIDQLEADIELEFYGVRKEMDNVYDSAKKQFYVLNRKFDNFMYTKDVEECDKITIRL